MLKSKYIKGIIAISVIMVIAVIILVAFSLLKSEPIIGRWQHVGDSGVIIEFLKDGKIISTENGDENIGEYSISDNNIIISWDSEDIVSTFEIKDKNLIITNKYGVDTYKKR